MTKPVLVGFDAIKRPVRLHSNKRLTHQHIIGSSGSGKSKFIEQMIRGDIGGGQGLCLIDPHGTLYDDIVKYCAFFGINRRVLLFNLSKPTHINGFNFFANNPNGDISVQVDNRIKAVLHAWDAENADNTPTLERIFRLIFTTMLDAGLSLPEVSILLDFKEKAVRDSLIAKIENDLIRREWQELSNLQKATDFRNEILSAKNRLFRLLTSKALMRFIGVKEETYNLKDEMDRQSIILVNLAQSQHLSSENARVFGSLLVSQFFESANQREKRNGEDPKPFYLYIDELANFVSIDLCNALDELRKFGLFCVLSHQRFGQLDEDMIDAVLTNCQIKTVFGGLPHQSAEIMAKEMFIGKLDPMKIKVAIYQTKHLYKYSRDTVYSRSSSRGEGSSHGEGVGSSSGFGSTTADNSGQMMSPPSEDFFSASAWFGSPEVTGLSESNSEGYSYMNSDSEFTTSSTSESYSESEGETDVPIFIPVPYKELGSVQYFTLEEQLHEMIQALKLQMQRHCFIQLPGTETQPLLVPFVKDYYISSLNLERYIARISKDALSPTEADQKISNSLRDLLQLKDSKAEPKKEVTQKKKTPKKEKNKVSIFDKLKDEIDI